MRDLPTAALETISYSALVSGDASEAAKLLSLSVQEGFFYLDLQGEDKEAGTLGQVDRIYEFMRTWFNQPAEAKLEHLQTNYTDG